MKNILVCIIIVLAYRFILNSLFPLRDSMKYEVDLCGTRQYAYARDVSFYDDDDDDDMHMTMTFVTDNWMQHIAEGGASVGAWHACCVRSKVQYPKLPKLQAVKLRPWYAQGVYASTQR